MKKTILFLAFMVLLVCALSFVIGAQDIYLEEIPEELKVENDTVTHFIVIDDIKYFVTDGSSLVHVNQEEIAADLEKLGITTADLGVTYLTKFVFPAYSSDGTLLTFININVKGAALKESVYFRNVCGYMEFPGTATETNDTNQCNSQIRCVDFGENSQITYIPFCFLKDASRLRKVMNFPTENLEEIRGEAFNGTRKGFKGELVLNAKYIRQSAFNNATTYVTGLVFGENFELAETQALSIKSSETGLGAPRLEYVEFKGDVTKIVGSGSYKPLYFELGGSSRSEYTNLKCIILSNPANADDVKAGKTFSEIAPNSKIQFFLDTTKEVVSLGHDISTDGATISYDSYLENGVISGYCTKCQKTENTLVEALFIFNGYSAKIGGSKITVGYTINQEALVKVKEANPDFAYGVVAYAPEDENDYNPILSDKTLKNPERTILAEINATDYYGVNFILNGFDASSYDITLIMCAYVYDGESIYYLGREQSENAPTVVFSNEATE